MDPQEWWHVARKEFAKINHKSHTSYAYAFMCIAEVWWQYTYFEHIDDGCCPELGEYFQRLASQSEEPNWFEVGLATASQYSVLPARLLKITVYHRRGSIQKGSQVKLHKGLVHGLRSKPWLYSPRHARAVATIICAFAGFSVPKEESNGIPPMSLRHCQFWEVQHMIWHPIARIAFQSMHLNRLEWDLLEMHMGYVPYGYSSRAIVELRQNYTWGESMEEKCYALKNEMQWFDRYDFSAYLHLRHAKQDYIIDTLAPGKGFGYMPLLTDVHVMLPGKESDVPGHARLTWEDGTVRTYNNWGAHLDAVVAWGPVATAVSQLADSTPCPARYYTPSAWRRAIRDRAYTTYPRTVQREKEVLRKLVLSMVVDVQAWREKQMVSAYYYAFQMLGRKKCSAIVQEAE